MNYYTIQPTNILADCVRFFWVLEGEATNNQPFVHRVIADSCPEFIFYYKGEFSRRTDSSQSEKTLVSGLYGQTQQFSKFTAKNDFGIFGVYLYPYAIPQLFSLPASELSDQSADVKTISGVEGKILEEKIMLASNNVQRVKLVSDFLTARLKNTSQSYSNIFSSIKQILNTDQVISIKSLADNCFLSRRQFERKFKEFSGFSPKMFLRIVRFNSVIKENPQRKSLTQIGNDCGYYDQSHFIHDFSNFSGYNAKEFFKHNATGIDYRASSEFKS